MTLCRSIACSAVLLALVAPPSGLAQDVAAARADLQAQVEAAQKVAAIEADKPGFVADLLSRVASLPGGEKVNDTFMAKGTRRLMQKSATQLSRLSEQAKDFDTFVKLAFAGYTIDTFGQLTQDLVFFPMAACRIYDSRSATVAGLAGPMAPGTQREVSVNDSTAGQGGSATACSTLVPDLDFDPPALAITITATGATGPGNLRTFGSGGTVPLAAMLTYAAGSTISTGTVTASDSSGLLSNELTVRNQGAGNTDVVIDIVGYFHAPRVQPLSCQNVSTIGGLLPANNIATINSPACPAGTTLTGGGIDTNFSTAEIWVYRSEPNAAGTAWTCTARSQYAFDWAFFDCHARCCSIPGR